MLKNLLSMADRSFFAALCKGRLFVAEIGDNCPRAQFRVRTLEPHFGE